MFSKYGVPVGAPPVYTDVALPAATAVPDGFVVWNSTYKVLLRNNGTRWLALGSIALPSLAPGDAVSGTTAETAFRSIAAPTKYLGPNGRLKILAAVTAGNTSANPKGLRIRVGPNGDLTDTLFVSTGTAIAGSTNNFIASREIQAVNSMSSQRSSNLGASAASTGSTAGIPVGATIDFDATNYVTFSAILQSGAGGGESLTLTGCSIHLLPGN